MIIDTQQIECFLSVAAHLNFTAAANEMFISQPAISRKVASLEKELGVNLIDRSSRELKLTKEGIRFQKFFRGFIDQLEEITIKNRVVEGETCEEIKIGIFEGWNINHFIGKLESEFKMSHENIAFTVDTCSEKDLIKGLRDGRYDLVFLLKISIKCAITAGYISEVVSYNLADVKKRVFFSANNPLAEKASLKFEDFMDQDLHTFKSEIVPLDIIINKELLNKYGIAPKIKMLSTLDAVINAIGRGKGFALFDDLIRIKDNHAYRYLDLAETHTISMVRSKENKRDVIDQLFTFIKNMDPSVISK